MNDGNKNQKEFTVKEKTGIVKSKDGKTSYGLKIVESNSPIKVTKNDENKQVGTKVKIKIVELDEKNVEKTPLKDAPDNEIAVTYKVGH